MIFYLFKNEIVKFLAKHNSYQIVVQSFRGIEKILDLKDLKEIEYKDFPLYLNDNNFSDVIEYFVDINNLETISLIMNSKELNISEEILNDVKQYLKENL